MNILQVNKFFFVSGGAARYFIEVSRLLANHKHRVAYFSTYQPENKKTEWDKYFAVNDPIGTITGLFYSIEAKKKMIKLLDDYSPDISHLHSIYHHLSASVILELKRRRIPIVQTIHDYHLIAPNRSLFHNGEICEITKPDKFYKAISHKCVKDSYLASFLEVLEKYFQYFVCWERNLVDLFIAPSLFMRDKLVEFGIDPKKITHLTYFVDANAYTPSYGNGDYILYFGRLSAEKGLSFLIDVMSRLPKLKLLIAGRGNEEQALKNKIEKLRRQNIRFIGFKDGKELKSLIRNARFTVLPSLWYDVSPISILEANACGKPMVVSDIGGIPEIVRDDQTGLLFRPGDTEDCREKILKLWNKPILCSKLGKNAREFVAKNFGSKDHYDKLMDIYKKVI
ncbi:hypothetical protein A2960_02340 [Candidatus Gottesmanbacteria bacterium RIFCSPLOWO2_01_FULL_39_12b]|uniref:Glycosyl transferase family 1 domain-containing protein n=1 Tax=Candidatus Gottesmanbacteria bacterium RIFCSPLOWO2_01_FULL_39_12b TaxID=1798388 RepID=A0A1F6AR48_9BACT|nr:MAG: hypothetical protein A2960_02340 [Candidatus Gottesmanbacteria bacterium RIFCSPLOWO2_01_FULL_39_12b]